MKKTLYFVLFLIVTIALFGSISCSDSSDGEGDDDTPGRILLSSLTFADPNLANCVYSSIYSYVDELRFLYAEDKNISSLSGIENLTYLSTLLISNNNIADLSFLSDLSYLGTLNISNNNISDISDLASITSLQNLEIVNNNITDISALSSLTNFGTLNLGYNNIIDISALAGLNDLDYLWLYNNNIIDVSPLAGLTNLINLILRDNNITDGIATLVNLTKADIIDLSGDGNSGIPSADFDTLEAALGVETIIRPNP